MYVQCSVGFQLHSLTSGMSSCPRTPCSKGDFFSIELSWLWIEFSDQTLTQHVWGLWGLEFYPTFGRGKGGGLQWESLFYPNVCLYIRITLYCHNFVVGFWSWEVWLFFDSFPCVYSISLVLLCIRVLPSACQFSYKSWDLDRLRVEPVTQ